MNQEDVKVLCGFVERITIAIEKQAQSVVAFYEQAAKDRDASLTATKSSHDRNLREIELIEEEIVRRRESHKIVFGSNKD